MSVGASISHRRLAKKLTQRQLAAALGIDPITVSRWERDETVPSNLNRYKLAELFGIHPDLLRENAKEAA